jgi:aryl-alcohol dehydrogenase-like predicted oxidoreductase
VDTVTLGAGSAEVSALCLGTDYYGSRTPAATAHRLMDEFAAAGGNFLDTSNIYAAFLPGFVGGESETTIGDWMARRRNRSSMFVATKVCGDYQDVPYGLRAADIRRECDKSLRRLRTDVIDLYYAHADDRQTPLEEIVEAFDSLVTAGKVRYVGVSNWATWRLAEARQVALTNGWATPSVLEYRHTYLRPRPGSVFLPQIAVTDQLLDYAREKELPIVAYSILLNGAYSRADREVPEDYAGPDTDARLQTLAEIAAETGATPAQVVIAWLRQSPQQIVPIIGGSTVEQIRENIAGAELRLSDEQIERLTSAGPARAKNGDSV